jgi:hypothetical protein
VCQLTFFVLLGWFLSVLALKTLLNLQKRSKSISTSADADIFNNIYLCNSCRQQLSLKIQVLVFSTPVSSLGVPFKNNKIFTGLTTCCWTIVDESLSCVMSTSRQNQSMCLSNSSCKDNKFPVPSIKAIK